MEQTILIQIAIDILLGSIICLVLIRMYHLGYIFNILWISILLALDYQAQEQIRDWAFNLLTRGVPLYFINILLLVYFPKPQNDGIDARYKLKIKHKKGKLTLNNIRRGIAIIGAAGSGKTESVVLALLKHFKAHHFSGVIHDYKNFEITELAYPIFKEKGLPFHIISFDKAHTRVNPIASRYLPDEESVNEVSRVLVENLLEQDPSRMNATSRFFNDVVEGLIGGMIWRLKTDYPDYCTLPHIIALYQSLSTQGLIKFLNGNTTSRAMAGAFIEGVDSERQTAGVKSTLSNAFKKISTEKIFMTLSADELNLNINHPESKGVVAIVNNPRIETSLSPVIATIIHTITKQMSIRDRNPSFLLMEEASTIRLLNMHRIPATLRSYDITTVYVLQDKVQNDLMYGPMASKAILSNLSYQFFGKANDPDTAKYYERFFEIVKRETTSINRGYNLDFDTRITKGEREVAKNRASTFYGLRQGEFVVLADGKDQKIQFKKEKLQKSLPEEKVNDKEELRKNYNRIHWEIKALFKSYNDEV